MICHCGKTGRIHVQHAKNTAGCCDKIARALTLGGLNVGDLIGVAEETGFQLIGLSPEEAVTYGTLGEETHFDPFDRMLIWQAIHRNLTMVSRDAEFEKFVPQGLQLLWQ